MAFVIMLMSSAAKNKIAVSQSTAFSEMEMGRWW